jgi:MFS transporter, SHS family, lactate transporter
MNSFRAYGLVEARTKQAVHFVLLMTVFNFSSHGTQNLYPTFLQTEHRFCHETVSVIAIVYNVGAIVGGLRYGNTAARQSPLSSV